MCFQNAKGTIVNVDISKWNQLFHEMGQWQSITRRCQSGQDVWCESTSLPRPCCWILQPLTTRQVCHVRPQAQNAGKIYPTCGFTCAAMLTSSPTSKGNVPILDPLVKSFQKLSLPNHSPGTHYSPQQSLRADRHSQHSSYGHSQSPRGVTRRQTAPADHHSLTQVHQPFKCVVCFLLPSSDLSRQMLCNRFAGSPIAMGDMLHVGWNVQKRCACRETLTRKCAMWVFLGVLPSNLNLSQTCLLVLPSSTQVSWS